MNHTLKISVSRKPPDGGIVACRTVKLRERLLRRLLGNPCKMAILVPGDSVESVAITETPEGGDQA